MRATLARNSLDKMLSASAVTQSESPREHAMAVANLDRLFADSVEGWSKTDKNKSPEISAVHRRFAPLRIGHEARLAKITVLEHTNPIQPNSLYSVESIEVGELSPVPEDMAKADAAESGSHLLAGPTGLVESLTRAIQEFNRGPSSVVHQFESGH